MQSTSTFVGIMPYRAHGFSVYENSLIELNQDELLLNNINILLLL
jgi:hypothetical protein